MSTEAQKKPLYIQLGKQAATVFLVNMGTQAAAAMLQEPKDVNSVQTSYSYSDDKLPNGDIVRRYQVLHIPTGAQRCFDVHVTNSDVSITGALRIKDNPSMPTHRVKLVGGTIAIGCRITRNGRKQTEYEDAEMKRMRHAFRAIVSAYVLHGNDWVNRAEEVIPKPWGNNSKQQSPKSFMVTDGRSSNLTFNMAIRDGAFASDHVGELMSPRSSAYLRMGIPVLLEEFEREDKRYGFFARQRIARESSGHWGGAVPWLECGRDIVTKLRPDLQDIAQQATTPFAFHLAATHRLYPNAQSLLGYLYQTIGRETLDALLNLVAQRYPARFYRAVNPSGLMCTYSGADCDNIHYEGVTVPRQDVAKNVLETCEEMLAITKDSSINLNPRVRVVIDTHMVMVLTAVAQICLGRGTTTHVSGPIMGRYLLGNASDARMHAIRNSELWTLFHRQGLVAQSEHRVCLYPATFSDVVPSQYTPCDMSAWESRIIR